PGSFGLMKGASAQYFEVSNIHIGHGRDTSLHAHLVFISGVIFFSFSIWLAGIVFDHPPILTLS
ncbi:hypothetical protein, partial [Akkermansia sp.]|uniref:hypothetical protein n=1 Tax=Akkermansia sp. TaxID=1872421 RepID=UPI0025C351B9